LTGETLAPVLGVTATAQRDGVIGDGHVRVIRNFFRHLPDSVDAAMRDKAEAQLVNLACEYGPDQLAKLAQRLLDCLHPDGEFTEREGAGGGGRIGENTGGEGMSRIPGSRPPEAGPTGEAVMGRWGARGWSNPADDVACVDGAPSQDTIKGDTRSTGQRQHDA